MEDSGERREPWDLGALSSLGWEQVLRLPPPDPLGPHRELWAVGSLGPLGSACLLLGEGLRSPRIWASFLVSWVQESLRSGAHQGLGEMRLRHQCSQG